MSASTANSFPALHGFNMSRSWFLAAIVLVHLGFFWALSSYSIHIVQPGPQEPVVLVPFQPVEPPPPTNIEVRPQLVGIFVPPTTQPSLQVDDTHQPQQTTSDPMPLPPPTSVTEGPGQGPYIVEPQLDSRYPFSEPEYPVAEIRQGHEGTVLLSLQILPNGRVGAVRIDQSSGYAKLDEAAAREARRWRMKPGTSDGVTMAMWKRVPIKFQLKN
jgi:periplasmic protein TonB